MPELNLSDLAAENSSDGDPARLQGVTAGWASFTGSVLEVLQNPSLSPLLPSIHLSSPFFELP